MFSISTDKDTREGILSLKKVKIIVIFMIHTVHSLARNGSLAER
jgi:hypothetical protein